MGLLHATNTNVEKGFVIPNQGHLGGINCIGVADVTKDGNLEVFFGRDDGYLPPSASPTRTHTNILSGSHIEVWTLGEDFSEPRQIFQKQIGESIQAIDYGHVQSVDKIDIIVATYSGKIMAFTEQTPNAVCFVMPCCDVM